MEPKGPLLSSKGSEVTLSTRHIALQSQSPFLAFARDQIRIKGGNRPSVALRQKGGCFAKSKEQKQPERQEK
jgi:hypothetical protein